MRKITTTTRVQLIISMMASVLIPTILINLFYYQQLNESTKAQLLSYQREIVQQSSDDVQALVDQINITTRQLIAMSVSSDMYTNYNEKTPSEKLNTVKSLQRIMQSIVFSVSYHAGTYYIGTDNSVFSNLNTLNADKLLSSIGMEENGVPFEADYYSNVVSVRVIPFLTDIQNYNRYNALQTIGIDLQYSDLENIFAGKYKPEEIEIFIVNDDNKLIYYLSRSDFQWERSIGKALNNEQLSYLNDFNHKGKERIDNYVPGPGWNVYSYIHLNAFEADASAQNRTLLLILLMTLFFAFIFSYFVSKSITRPINALITKMKRIGQDDKKQGMMPIVTGNKDIMVLSANFDEMLIQIERLNKITIEKEKEKTSMQLRALQAQINPHFLYNTLEDIRSIALENNIISISEMTKALARIFRYCISKENIVTVREEIAHIRNYAQIQHYRYGERLSIMYYVDEKIMDCRIVKFILQPIIENALSHGIEPKLGKGVITIIGGIKEQKIEFRIIDNGIGMTPEQLVQINNDLADRRESSRGIGLINVDMRLKLHYGEQYGIVVESHFGEGTQVTVRMPYVGETV
ncbi:histidine kinase [Eisenbergiella sp.]